jgi:hypothetical protein
VRHVDGEGLLRLGEFLIVAPCGHREVIEARRQWRHRPLDLLADLRRKRGRLLRGEDFLSRHVVIHDRRPILERDVARAHVLLRGRKPDRRGLGEMRKPASCIAALRQFGSARAHGRDRDAAEEFRGSRRAAEPQFVLDQVAGLHAP